MIAETHVLERLVAQAKELSPEYRLRLIQRITDTLLPLTVRPSQPLPYGKYNTGTMSTLEDFAVAEWHPSDKEFYGE